MPTGVAMRDARVQLFEAAERILLREGPSGLTSRALTAEAGCAKGVLHRHFADFDSFLCELVLDCARRFETTGSSLLYAAGSGAVEKNVTDVLISLFDSVALGIVSLLIFRDDLLAKIRNVRPSGVPLLTDAASAVADYLRAERNIGRVGVDADIDVLAPTLIGAVHLLCADRSSRAPDPVEIRHVVATVMSGALVDHP